MSLGLVEGFDLSMFVSWASVVRSANGVLLAASAVLNEMREKFCKCGVECDARQVVELLRGFCFWGNFGSSHVNTNDVRLCESSSF